MAFPCQSFYLEVNGKVRIDKGVGPANTPFVHSLEMSGVCQVKQQHPLNTKLPSPAVCV